MVKWDDGEFFGWGGEKEVDKFHPSWWECVYSLRYTVKNYSSGWLMVKGGGHYGWVLNENTWKLDVK